MTYNIKHAITTNKAILTIFIKTILYFFDIMKSNKRIRKADTRAIILFKIIGY